MDAEVKKLFKMTIDLNVLNHLGVNLYSNVPAVLAEAVANSWDADATSVEIRINSHGETISICDDGHGMSVEDINEKFLRVGYQRRENEDPVTSKFQRPVMGRKGIGKLSLFSVADVIDVHSRFEGHEPIAFSMSLPEIQEAIREGRTQGTYHPLQIVPEMDSMPSGTRIVLRKPRKRLNQTEKALRRRLARRFSILGSDHEFEINLNNEPIDIADRDYYRNLQYVWYYGEYGRKCVGLCSNLEHKEERKGSNFQGWIGTVKESGQLMTEGDSWNKIVVMARGKLVQEDILQPFGETGLYSKFIIGEICADELDEDARPDIVTTNRQSVIEDDERNVALCEAVKSEITYIKNQWTALRNKVAKEVAFENYAIKEWFDALGKDDQRRAEQIFGKVNRIMVDKPEQRAILFQYSVLAFECLKAKQNLDALGDLTGDTIVEFGKVFGHLDDLEATLYHQIVKGRIGVVRALRNLIEDDEKERVIQKHLFDHLWLLDPSWEKVSGSEYMEQRLIKEFEKISNSLTDEELQGRVDIKYRTTAGKHIIVELKRASVRTDTFSLLKQVNLYRSALKKLLSEAKGEQNPKIEVVCVVGNELNDWSNFQERQESESMLNVKGVRVVLYDQLINSAFNAYQEFLDKSTYVEGRISRLLQNIEEDVED